MAMPKSKNIHKNTISKIFNQFKILGVPRISKSSKLYLKFAAELISALENELGDNLLASFIYGSVTRGQADTGRSLFETNCYVQNKYVGTIFDNKVKSDIDICVVVKNPQDFENRVIQITKSIFKDFPQEMLISVLLFPEKSVVSGIKQNKSPNIYNRLFGISTKIVLSDKDSNLQKYINGFKPNVLDIDYEAERLKTREIVSAKARKCKSMVFVKKEKLLILSPTWTKFHMSEYFEKTPTSAFGHEILKLKIPKRYPLTMNNINFENSSKLNLYLNQNKIIEFK